MMLGKTELPDDGPQDIAAPLLETELVDADQTPPPGGDQDPARDAPQTEADPESGRPRAHRSPSWTPRDFVAPKDPDPKPEPKYTDIVLCNT